MSTGALSPPRPALVPWWVPPEGPACPSSRGPGAEVQDPRWCPGWADPDAVSVFRLSDGHLGSTVSSHISSWLWVWKMWSFLRDGCMGGLLPPRAGFQCLHLLRSSSERVRVSALFTQCPENMPSDVCCGRRHFESCVSSLIPTVGGLPTTAGFVAAKSGGSLESRPHPGCWSSDVASHSHLPAASVRMCPR